MPNVGPLHPQVVHFVVALLFVGVACRVVSLLTLRGRLAFSSPMATVLILLGAAASVIAVKSGTDAHGPVERVPGARTAVTVHEEWGERTRNVFLVVAALELAALALRARPAGRHADAARLVDELARRMPGDPSVRLMGIESMLRDRHDAPGALAALDSLQLPAGNRAAIFGKRLLTAEAIAATGRVDSARALLERMRADFPNNRRVQDAVARLGQPAR